jgi:predicted ester cyclase
MTNVKQVAKEFLESYNDRDLDRSWARYLSPRLVNHALGGAHDREGWLKLEKSFLSSFPDLHVEVLDQVAEGDRVATRFAMKGTHTHEFFGVAPKGVVATLTGTAFDRIEDGKIAEHWSDVDIGGFLQQLSAPPA